MQGLRSRGTGGESQTGGPMLKKLAFCFMILLSATIILTAVLTLYFRSEQGKSPSPSFSARQ